MDAEIAAKKAQIESLKTPGGGGGDVPPQGAAGVPPPMGPPPGAPPPAALPEGWKVSVFNAAPLCIPLCAHVATLAPCVPR